MVAYTYLPQAVMDTLGRILPFWILPIVACGLLICIVHSGFLMGWKNTAKFFGFGYIIAYIFEEISVHTGLIFGLYYFPPIMGPKLDVIPFCVPMFWLMCFYVSWYITNLIMDKAPLPTDWSVGRIIAGAFIGGAILTTLDLSADPFCTANGFWVWPNGGTFFNEPIHNFVGWFLTGAFTFIFHGFVLKKDADGEPMTLDAKWKRILSIIAVVVYCFFGIGFGILNVHEVLGLPTALAIGIPAALALYNWVNWYKEENI